MDKIRIVGGKRLQGSVKISGAKNAALPILFTTLLTDQKVTLSNLPRLEDIKTTLKLLEHLGVSVEEESPSVVHFKSDQIKTFEAPYDHVRKMRASILVLGPILSRFGEAKVSLPGGCAIGARPVDIHLKGMEALGAKIELEGGYVLAKAKKLLGNRIPLSFPSVGATENLMMAASLAKGESVIENAAREPEIVDLGLALQAAGVEIEGLGSSEIKIQGKENLQGFSHSIMGDRIEAGTYLSSAVLTGGEVMVEGILPDALDAVLEVFKNIGSKIECNGDRITLSHFGEIHPQEIITAPFPGFPTDMQAQLMAVLCFAKGESRIQETVFENRFMHVPELSRLGANIRIEGNTAIVTGVKKLKAAPLMATDLRASASLILAALASEGESIIQRVYHLDRGYEDLEKKFSDLGAEIERIKG